MNDVLTLSLELLTVAQEDGPRQTGPDFGKASPFGLIILILLLIGVFGLVWSMNRHLRKLPKSFDKAQPGGTGAGGPEPGREIGADPDLATENPADGTERGSG